MRRFYGAALAAVAAVGFTSISFAADLPVKAPAYKAPAAYNWTGFYMGGFIGGAWANGQAGATELVTSGLGGYNTPNGHSWPYGLGRSFIGGATIGYNYQVNQWVLGLEGEIGSLRMRGSAGDPIFPNFGTLDTVASTKIGDWYGVIAGRFGYAWDRALVYVKGGAAFVEVRSSVVDTCPGPFPACGSFLINTSNSKTVATWALGAGLEYALTQNWTVKGEYLYLGIHETLRTCGIETSGTGGQFCWDHNVPGVSLVKIGINYKFGG